MKNNVATNNDMKTAVIYARYSSNSQTEQSIEGQLDVCNKFAEDNNLKIVGTYIDRAMTGTNDNRPDFQRMIKDSEKAKWDVVLVYALDRFGRSSIDIAVNKQKLQSNKKVLISATQKTSDNLDGTKNLDGIILENVYIGIAEYYSAELSQKVLRGQRENRKKGLFCGGTIPYGYYVKDKKLYINEEEADVVRYMYEQYSIGNPVYDIQKDLEEKGIMHKGSPFKENAVYGILKNKKYTGIFETHGEVFTNVYPEIIPLSLYEKVQSKFVSNKGKHAVNTMYILRHKITCGYCGKTICAECGTSARGYTRYYYKCRGRQKRQTDCKKMAIRKEVLEKIVIDSIIDTLSNTKILDDMVAKLYELQDEFFYDNNKLKILNNELKQVNISINNLLLALENGSVTKITTNRLQELEKRQEELKHEIAVEETRTLNKLTETEIKKFYIDNLKRDPMIMIDVLVKQIILYDDRMTIIFNTPLEKSPDESQGFSFFQKTSLYPIKKNRNAKMRYGSFNITCRL